MGGDEYLSEAAGVVCASHRGMRDVCAGLGGVAIRDWWGGCGKERDSFSVDLFGFSGDTPAASILVCTGRR